MLCEIKQSTWCRHGYYLKLNNHCVGVEHLNTISTYHNITFTYMVAVSTPSTTIVHKYIP